MDVDGTLTDGSITYAEDGTEWKSFHSKDGAGIKFLALAGIETAIVTGRDSPVVSRRAAELGVRHVVQGVGDKAAVVRRLRARRGFPAAAVAFAGDDLSDLAAMREAGFSAAPADAAREVREAATFVSAHGGGRGAVRDAIEALLRREGRWEAVLAAFDAPANKTEGRPAARGARGR
jgi:3-deoxy-D-manno-octulosonate 8-phosphate phosphatase (KDO 8-P phosphatase)